MVEDPLSSSKKRAEKPTPSNASTTHQLKRFSVNSSSP